MAKILKKSLKFLLYSLIALIITGNLVIVLTGRFYLYKGISNTYLKGRSGPTIYDLEVFDYSTIKAPEHKSPTKIVKEGLNKVELDPDEVKFLEELKSKALLVYKSDSLVFEKYWDGHTEQTVSNSYSIAKTLVALLVGIAVDEGYIESLDEPVATFIPEFENLGREIITIRHLLAMSSGLDWEESGKNPFSDNAESYYGNDLYGHVTRQRLVRKPGQLFRYQSGNSQLLGFIVEEATGMGLNEYAEEKIWKKIGANHDFYWSLDKEGGDEKAFCCMYATARDFGKLGLLINNKGKWNGEQVFPLWFYHEMIAPTGLTTEDGIKNSRYGLHIWTYIDDEGDEVNYCRGILGQYIITIPQKDLVLIRLGDQRKSVYHIPEDKRDDREFVQENKHKVGHCLGLFEYISLAKRLTSNIEE